jgi:ferritin-like metal-binding protein YciE
MARHADRKGPRYATSSRSCGPAGHPANIAGSEKTRPTEDPTIPTHVAFGLQPAWADHDRLFATDTGGTCMAIQTIEELFEHELKDIYGAEQSLLDALQQMADESDDREIKKGFLQHRKETQGQIKRIEKIFKSMGQKAEAETCAGMEGLIKEKKLFMREKPSAELVEFYNIGAAQKVERYEITAYESLIDMAEKLGMSDAVELLEQSLQEEDSTLNRLKAIASEFEVTEDSEEMEEQEETSSSRR